jgi:ATP synthase protein I
MLKNIQPWRTDSKKIITLSSLGLMLPSSIAVGLVIGYFLDKAFGTQPWLLILFFFFGTASGITSLLRGLNRLNEGKEKDQATKNNGQ